MAGRFFTTVPPGKPKRRMEQPKKGGRNITKEEAGKETETQKEIETDPEVSVGERHGDTCESENRETKTQKEPEIEPESETKRKRKRNTERERTHTGRHAERPRGRRRAGDPGTAGPGGVGVDYFQLRAGNLLALRLTGL